MIVYVDVGVPLGAEVVDAVAILSKNAMHLLPPRSIQIPLQNVLPFATFPPKSPNKFSMFHSTHSRTKS